MTPTEPTDASAPPPRKISVIRCARCGFDHQDLALIAMVRPLAPPAMAPVRWTHWTPCPTNGDPIMVMVCEDPDVLCPQADAAPSALSDIISHAARRFDARPIEHASIEARRELAPVTLAKGEWPATHAATYAAVEISTSVDDPDLKVVGKLTSTRGVVARASCHANPRSSAAIEGAEHHVRRELAEGRRRALASAVTRAEQEILLVYKYAGEVTRTPGLIAAARWLRSASAEHAAFVAEMAPA